MELTLVKNDDTTKIALYKIARAIYAETHAKSLVIVEALASVVGNLCAKQMRTLTDIATDEGVFSCLNKNSDRYNDMFIESADPKFQMCLRAVKRMTTGYLSDSVYGATRFHRIEQLPDWAVSIGYIAELEDFLFYL